MLLEGAILLCISCPHNEAERKVSCVGLLEHSLGMWNWEMQEQGPPQSSWMPTYLLCLNHSFLFLEKQLWQVLFFFFSPQWAMTHYWLTQKLSRLTYSWWGIYTKVSALAGSCSSGIGCSPVYVEVIMLTVSICSASLYQPATGHIYMVFVDQAGLVRECTWESFDGDVEWVCWCG